MCIRDSRRAVQDDMQVSYYWTRSPFSENKKNVMTVHYTGKHDGATAAHESMHLRPVLNIRGSIQVNSAPDAVSYTHLPFNRLAGLYRRTQPAARDRN